jgi:hypothetical protein
MADDVERWVSVLSVIAARQAAACHTDLGSFLSTVAVLEISHSTVHDFRLVYNQTHDIASACLVLFASFTYERSRVAEFLKFSTLPPSELSQALPFLFTSAIYFILHCQPACAIDTLSEILCALFRMENCNLENSMLLYHFLLRHAMTFVAPPVPEEFVSFVCAHLCFYSPGGFDSLLATLLLLKSVPDKSQVGRSVASSVRFRGLIACCADAARARSL